MALGSTFQEGRLNSMLNDVSDAESFEDAMKKLDLDNQIEKAIGEMENPMTQTEFDAAEKEKERLHPTKLKSLPTSKSNVETQNGKKVATGFGGLGDLLK